MSHAELMSGVWMLQLQIKQECNRRRGVLNKSRWSLRNIYHWIWTPQSPLTIGRMQHSKYIRNFGSENELKKFIENLESTITQVRASNTSNAKVFYLGEIWVLCQPIRNENRFPSSANYNSLSMSLSLGWRKLKPPVVRSITLIAPAIELLAYTQHLTSFNINTHTGHTQFPFRI